MPKTCFFVVFACGVHTFFFNENELFVLCAPINIIIHHHHYLVYFVVVVESLSCVLVVTFETL